MTGVVLIDPITSDGRIPVIKEGLLYSHDNTQTTNISLTANKNYYVDSMYVINSGVTVTIPSKTLLKIA